MARKRKVKENLTQLVAEIRQYSSKKMGVIIQFDRHSSELALIYCMEYDQDVLEYYDQPPKIKLQYEALNGRRIGVLHTPDFFVIRQNRSGWEECKIAEELDRLSTRTKINCHYEHFR